MSFKKFKELAAQDPRFSKLNFEIDGRLHYVYRVSYKKEDSHYYGSKTEKNGVFEKTIGINYFTSSRDKIFKKNFKVNTEQYTIKIIKQFDNPADKILYESYLHQYFNVKNHTNFINRANQTPYRFDTTGLEVSEKAKEGIRLSNIAGSKPVYQYSLSGKYIKEFDSRNKAAKEVGLVRSGDIGACCRGQNTTAAGFIWRNTKVNKVDPYIKYNIVYQYDLDGNYVNEFSTQIEAAKEVGLANSCDIGICCREEGNLNKTAGGFRWKNYKVSFLVVA